VSSEGDLGAWGRNWHEMVILSGIEMQRQKVSRDYSHRQTNIIHPRDSAFPLDASS
jgi:hypothetical protein